jgi:hypothetical protein
MVLEDSRVLGHSPEHGLLPECQGAGRVVSVVAEQYGVHPRYGVEMAAVHDVLPHDRISPRLAKYFQVGISLNAGLAGFPPIAPDLAGEAQPQHEACSCAIAFPPLSPEWLLPWVVLPMYRAICGRPVLGMTAAAIALGVQDTAVVPYRRRAYVRLTISRPYERMGLSWSADTGSI